MTLVRTLLVTVAGAAALAAPAYAQTRTVDVPFAPPEIEADPSVCTVRPDSHVLSARWAGYDGGPLGDRGISEIRRDLRLLRQDDPIRWFDTIAAANARMVEVFENYDETNRVLDRVDLLISAGRIEQLADENLFEDVLEQAEGGSNSALVTAADMLYQGQGVEKDVDRAISLYRRGAYAGHSSALLMMAELSMEREIEQWGIDPSVAVTMALGALLGDLDPMICDRVNRIAALYREGDVVTRDADLAEDWYRFSASLGGITSAWNVASMHKASTLIKKDNDVMMAHLRQAADGGLPYAILELGDILERGALADRDLDEARRLYEEAAAAGDETALIRLVNLARDDADGPEGRARYGAALDRLIERNDTPSWAYLQRGDLVLAEEGRWAGASRAAELYREALERDPENVTVRLRLAELDLNDVGTKEALLETASGLRNAVQMRGQTEPMQDLQSLFRCRAPSAPILSQADYWAEMEEFSGNTSIDLTAEEIEGLTREADPLIYAKNQAQAVNARARSLANLTHASGTPEAFEPMRQLVSDQGAAVQLADAKLAYDLGNARKAEVVAREAVSAEEPGAEDFLIRVLLDRFKAGEGMVRAELIALAEARAQQGNGRAIEALIEVGALDTREAWITYRDAINRNGDVDAMMFALPRVERDQVPVLRKRIRGIIECNTTAALDFADALRRAGEPDAALDWINTASLLLEGAGWERVAIGDALLVHSPESIDRAVDQYRTAAEAGYPVAMRRILSLRQDERIDMTAEETAGMFVTLVRSVPVEDVPQILQFLTYSDPDVRNLVNRKIDKRALYTDAAERGHPVAQLELARIIRDSRSEDDTPARYAELLTQSAEGGNAEAMFLLSQAYAYGIGVTPNAGTSREWLRAAADAGNEAAAATVEFIE